LNKETVFGLLTVLIGIGMIAYQTGIEDLFNILILFMLSVLSKFLWEMKVNSWNKLYLLKLPLNLFFNVFWLILIIKWWTNRDLIREFKIREAKS
jgi:hypothetical protein